MAVSRWERGDAEPPADAYIRLGNYPGQAAPGDDDLAPALSGKSAGCRMTEPGGGASDESDRMFHGRLRAEG